jgi:hypothetical protein
MIDLHSVIAFFHKGKWTELATTHEIDRVMGKNTISYSAAGIYVRMFVLSTKKSTFLSSPNRKVILVFTIASRLCPQKSYFFQSAELLRK